MKKATGYRQEHDSIGERAVPEQAYYGIQTLRAVENFCITRQRTHPALIESMVQVKKAAALANLAAGELDEKRAKAIAAACDEILGGALHDEFIVDPVQGGAGTSLNMNANEVIANRAIELLGGEKGNYALVSPNDHVNLGQSTNDVFPSAGRMAARRLLCCCFSKRMRKVFRKNEKSMLQNCNKKAKRKGRLQRVKKPM